MYVLFVLYCPSNYRELMKIFIAHSFLRYQKAVHAKLKAACIAQSR
jgi:hypothetical protein